MLTGITDDDMVSAVEPADVLKQILKTKKSLSKPLLCVMHYARFETPFLANLMELHGNQKPWPFYNICTFEIARRLYPNLPSRGIRALGGFLGFDMEEVKRSPSHVEATRVIWNHLVERLEERGVLTFEQLQEFLATKAEARSGKLEYKLDPLKRLELPTSPGVYRMKNQCGRVLYVGKATSLKSRVNSHFRGRKGKTSRSKELLTQVAEIDITECGSPLEAAILETDEIKRFDPPYNVSLKQRSRSLLFASRDFLSFQETQDELHCVGPLPNPRSVDAFLRLNVTINSGEPDPHIMFVEVPLDDLEEGVQIFIERHSISEDGVTPRSLLALGLSLFRSTRSLMRRLAAEEAEAAELASEELRSLIEAVEEAGEAVDAFDGGDGEPPDGEDLDDDFDDDDELTPEEIATKLESLVIGVARTYLASKEITRLLNSTIRFQYKKSQRDLFVREGRVQPTSSLHVETESDSSVREVVSNCHWSNLDVRDYDRMRVLLTEVTRMMTTQSDIQIEPPLTLLSRW